MRKIGLLGGSFNPPHFGHVYISCQAIKELNLYEVWWLFCRKNPLKNILYEPFEIRAEKASDLIKMNRKIKIVNTDDVYTYKTLKCFKQKFPTCKFIWIAGMDSIISFHKWDRWDEIGRSIKIAIFDRNRDFHKAMSSKFATRFHLWKSFHLILKKRQNISSTMIREFSR